MLTGNQVIARVKGSDLIPGRIKAKPAMVDAARVLGDLYTDAVTHRWTRGELEEHIGNAIAERSRPRVLQGMAKLLADRSTFEVLAPVPPSELRQIVFSRAAQRGPLALEAGPFERPTADQIIAEIAAELGVTATEVGTSLYADLEQHHAVTEVDVRTPEWLIDRYNVAQVQALLLKASELRIQVTSPSPARMRQLFRQVKFHQLLHRAHRVGQTLQITLDGPTSMFHQSSRYGMALANFFPALLLQPGPWSMEATVLWTKARHRKTLTVTHEDGLVSHYSDRGGYQSREAQWFAERFAALKTDWTLVEGEHPISLGDKGVLFPDFTLKQGNRVAHLELMGFWRGDDLAKKIDLLSRYGPGNVILAVSRKLRGSKGVLEQAPEWVLDFANVLPPKQVVAQAERLT